MEIKKKGIPVGKHFLFELKYKFNIVWIHFSSDFLRICRKTEIWLLYKTIPL